MRALANLHTGPMASPSTQQPLLHHPSPKPFSLFKSIFLFLSIAAVICLATYHLTVHPRLAQPHPSDLCSHSPDPSSCISVLSDATSTARFSALPAILRRSLLEIHASLAESVDLLRRINAPSLRSALHDCSGLLDLSRERIISSNAAIAAGSYAEARTWLSAVLTNHVTCRDGLDAPALAPLASRLDSLVRQGSAALAVLRSVAADDGGSTEAVIGLPAWIGPAERRLMEATSAAGVQVNVIVAADGSGKYKTVQAAVDAAPEKSKSRYVIRVKAGTYKENVLVGKNKKNLMFLGDGETATIITGSLNVVDGATTFDSATLAVEGDGFILQDICIENTAGPEKHQAVALRVSADLVAINRCQLRAYQDTLYTHTLRQFYRDSIISGTVDFIFGNAAVVFQNCNLTARRPMDKQKNAVTAQGRTDPNQNTGTSIQRCRVVPAPDLAPVKGTFPTYLGRPWKQYSRTVVMQSYIDDHVNPKGWLEWDGDFALKTLFYGEYQNSGPGAGTGGRVTWPGYHVITDPKVAQDFTVSALIQGGQWLGGTGVAFTEGL